MTGLNVGLFLEDEDTQKGRFLTFAIEEDTYGIEIQNIIEIIGVLPITQVPEVPEYIKGVINLRGKVVPVIDIRLKFGKNSIEYNDRTCIIVVEVDDSLVGVIVDTVDEVVEITDDKIVPPVETKSSSKTHYIKGIGKSDDRVTLLLDCVALLAV